MAKLVIGINAGILVVLLVLSYQCFAGGNYCFASPAAARAHLASQGIVHSNDANALTQKSEYLTANSPSKRPYQADTSSVNRSAETTPLNSRQTTTIPNDTPTDPSHTSAVHYYFDAHNHISKMTVGAEATADDPQTSHSQTKHSTQASTGSIVHINSDDVNAIDQGLIGIGAAKAQAIVAYREAHGRFNTVEDLGNVKGIGDATIRKNQSRIVLD